MANEKNKVPVYNEDLPQDSPKTVEKLKEISVMKEKQAAEKASPPKIEPPLDGRAEGELGLISTVLGCRENRDRIEFANDLKEFVLNKSRTEEEKKAKRSKQNLELASDYKLGMSMLLTNFVKDSTISNLARAMPKYEFISPSLALIIMSEVRKMLVDTDLIGILNEKSDEEKLPFDALRDLCSRFDKNFTDEHCAFITASYLTEIDEGTIFINFKEFLLDLKDTRSKDFEVTSGTHRPTSSIGSDGSDSEIKKIIRAGGSPLSDILNRSGKHTTGKKASMDEEHMLDIAEAIFIKMADLMIEKGRSVRGIFTKYAVPEIFPDRTVLELLSPPGFLEGMKETGVEELEEFEVACIMRVLAKPELDSAIILNEFVMIMENFGVMD